MGLSGYNNVLLYSLYLLNKLIMCLYTLRCFSPNKTNEYKAKTFKINSNAFVNV